jgi:hypothetical protein
LSPNVTNPWFPLHPGWTYRYTRAHSPFTSSPQALLTKEWTPLEPNVIDHKLYVRGVGTVVEQTLRGPTERNVLVSVTRR